MQGEDKINKHYRQLGQYPHSTCTQAVKNRLEASVQQAGECSCSAPYAPCE